MLRIKGGKVYDPANNVHGEIRDVCIADGRIVADVDGGRTIDATGMIVFPGGVDVHTHVAGAAINFARAMTPGRPPQSPSLSAHAVAPRRRRRRHADDFCDRVSVRRHGLDDGGGGGRAAADGQAHPRRAARHAHRGQGLSAIDGQQRGLHGPPGGRRAGAGETRRRLDDRRGQGLRRQGGQPRRRRGLEVGQGRQGAVQPRSKATAR